MKGLVSGSVPRTGLLTTKRKNLERTDELPGTEVKEGETTGLAGSHGIPVDIGLGQPRDEFGREKGS